MLMKPGALKLLNTGNCRLAAWCRFNFLLVIATLITLGAGAVFAATATPPKPHAIVPELSPPGQVEVKGALSAKISRTGEPLRFWVAVSNQTAQSVCTVTVMIPETASYGSATFPTSSGGSVSAPECPKEATPNSPDFTLAQGLRPGQSVTVQGKLDALESHDAQNIEAVVSWSSPAGVRSQTIVALGQSIIESGWERFGKGVYEFIKDFALPILLLALTLLFGWWDKQRESARKDADEQRERARKSAEEVRTWQAETWKQMLPISHRLATKHYTRIGASLRDALDSIEVCLEEKDPAKREPSEREALYNILLLGRQVEEMGNQVGGLFFKDRVGEKLAAQCWGDALEEFFGPTTGSDRINYQQSIDACPANGDGKAALIDKFKSGPAQAAPALDQAVWDTWVYFQKRYPLAAGKGAASLLRGFRAVLEYEMNRPYEHWYRRAEKLVMRRDDAKHINVEQVLRDAASKIQKEEGQDSDFVKQAIEYIEKGKTGKGDGESTP